MKSLRFVSIAVALLFAVTAFAASVAPVVFTMNENCVGTIAFPPDSPNPMFCGMTADPGPGGLGSAMTYGLAAPPVAGDLIMLEPGSSSPPVISDVIRFNFFAGDNGGTSTLVFYSDNFDGVDSLADTGFPTSLYANTVTVTEVGPEGNNGFTYIPTEGQPGFIVGFAATYNIISDSSVPEPSTASLMLIAGGLLFAGRRWVRRRSL